jgi:hypothetical protein
MVDNVDVGEMVSSPIWERRQMRAIILRVGEWGVGRMGPLVTAVLLAVVVGGIDLVAQLASVGQTPDFGMFESIYYNALLSGRDADAAMRKAHYLTGSLMQHFGMTRSEAATEVARTMIMRSGLLCSGS